jgi:hypothetical protein
MEQLPTHSARYWIDNPVDDLIFHCTNIDKDSRSIILNFLSPDDVKQLKLMIKDERTRSDEFEEFCDESLYEEFDDDFYLYSGEFTELEDYDYGNFN